MEVSAHSLPCPPRLARVRWWTFAIVSVALFMVVLDNLVVTTALPSIRADLGGGLQALEWTVNAYTLTFAVLLLTGAALGDRFGRRRMFVIGLGIFTVASAAAALAPTTGALIAARALQGAGARDRHPAHADAALRPRSRRRSAASRSAPGRASPASASRSARWSAAPSSTASRGTGSSGSTCRSASCSPRWPTAAWPSPTARRTSSTSPGLALGGLGLLGIVYGIVRGAELGWTSSTVLGSLLAGARPAGRVRRLGAARAGADAADALLPLARLRRLQRRLAGDVLRRLRLDLPARPVLPGRAGHVAARGRPAHAAVDGHADVRRADRGPALGPHRLAPADGRRAGAAGGRDRLAGVASRRPPSPYCRS